MNNEPPPVPSPVPPNPPAAEAGLQFDKAEFSQESALKCGFCQTPVTGEYFQINNQVSCPTCRQQVEAHFGQGGQFSRALVALVAGVGAAIAGCLIWWGIRAATGYEIGLVAIVVGWLVGAAVRWGSKQRGGWFYQLMAVGLTYLAMASTYTPDIMQGMREGRKEAAAAESTQISTNATSAEVSARETAPPDSGEELPFILALIIAFIFSLAAPFLMGFSNIIGLLILGFGLYQAWVMNRKTQIQVSGPYTVGRAA